MLLFIRAAEQIMRNWLVTVRMSVGIFMVTIAFLAVSYHYFGENVFDENFGSQSTQPIDGIEQAILLFIILGILFVAFACSIAVAWHRYILLDEAPRNMMMPGKVGRTWPYFAGSIKLLVASIPIYAVPIVIVFILAMSLPIADGLAKELLLILLSIPIFAFFQSVILRISMSLTSIAMDKKIGLREAFKLSEPYFHQVLVAAILVMAVDGAFSAIWEILTAMTILPGVVSTIIDFVLSAFVFWFSTFLNIGILTVLYGHIVEKREL